MTKKNTLGSVPDASMLTLFKGVVTFLGEEAHGRGWNDITERLKAVEKALAGLNQAERQAP